MLALWQQTGPFVSPSSRQLQASKNNYQLAFAILVQVESQIQNTKFGNFSWVLLCTAIYIRHVAWSEISGYSAMVVLIEQMNMEAYCTGFSVLLVAGQHTNDVWKQDKRVSVLFTVYPHLKTGTNRSLTIKRNDFVEGPSRLCHDKAMIIEGTGIIPPVTENTCCCFCMEPPSTN